MRRATPTISLLFATAVFAVSITEAPYAQPVAKAEPPKNLKVFPKDIARPELIANMRFFSKSLGVECNFCHAPNAGQKPGLDFASDAKPQKVMARNMLLMVHRINQADFGVTDPTKLKVTCFTCHRGMIKPATSPEAETPPEKTPAT